MVQVEAGSIPVTHPRDVAQLGQERLIWDQEVARSNRVVPTLLICSCISTFPHSSIGRCARLLTERLLVRVQVGEQGRSKLWPSQIRLNGTPWQGRYGRTGAAREPRSQRNPVACQLLLTLSESTSSKVPAASAPCACSTRSATPWKCVREALRHRAFGAMPSGRASHARHAPPGACSTRSATPWKCVREAYGDCLLSSWSESSRRFESCHFRQHDGLVHRLERATHHRGPVAQLVVHLLCKQAVEGSSPFWSTQHNNLEDEARAAGQRS